MTDGTRAATVLKRSALMAGTLGLVVAAWQALAEENRVTFPRDLDRLVHYTTVTRGSVTEHILTTPKAIAAVKAGHPVPAGTHFVLVDYREGQVFRYFVMENGNGWGADYDARRRTGDWQFQWFKPDRTINMAENTARCQSCHSAQADKQFLFTGDRIHTQR